MNFIPNVPPKVFSLSAVIVGYILIDDTNSAAEQNAMGNWLMLVAQVLCTNAFYRQVQTERAQNINGRVCSNEETLAMLTKIVDALNKEINEIKSEIK